MYAPNSDFYPMTPGMFPAISEEQFVADEEYLVVCDDVGHVMRYDEDAIRVLAVHVTEETLVWVTYPKAQRRRRPRPVRTIAAKAARALY